MKQRKTQAEIAAEKAAEIEATAAREIATMPVFIRRQKVKWPEQSAKGLPKKTMMNARMAIATLGLDAKLDVFHGRYTVNGTNLDGFIGDVSDKVTRKVRELSFCNLGLDPGGEATYDGICRACEEHRYDPLLDYLDGLKWDNVQRLDTWLTTYLGVEDTPLHRAQGRRVLIAAVRRLRDHGCKFDHVLVLEGPEGTYKSTVVQVLASGRRGGTENFSDSPILAHDERKQQELTKGVWFYEIAELAGMRKADQFAIKNFVTSQEERARPAYGRFQEIQPRVCIFVGTFNTTRGGELIEYLNAGDNRRWWPVRVGAIDIPALERDRDQLFAEADFEAMFGDASLFLPPKLEAEARAVQQEREVTDPLAVRLSTLYPDLTTPTGARSDHDPKTGHLTPSWKYGRDYTVTAREAWVSAKFVIEQLPVQLTSDSRKITAAMRACGWHTVRDRRSGLLARGYVHSRNC